MTDPYAGPPPRDLAKVLGKGAHPRAINRLVELWPEAHVIVSHRSRRYDGEDRRDTTVWVFEHKPSAAQAENPWLIVDPGMNRVVGRAECMLRFDHWNRRFGISLAFRRALRRVADVAAGTPDDRDRRLG